MGDNPLERVSQRRRRAQLMSKMSVQDQSVEGFIAGKQCFMKPSKQRASSTEKVLKGSVLCTLANLSAIRCGSWFDGVNQPVGFEVSVLLLPDPQQTAECTQ